MRVAQLSLVVAGLCLWAASRMPWVEIRSFDGLGQPKTVVLTGSSWSTALVPLVLLLLAAAVAALAVRGWPLRLLAVIVAAVSAGTAYLAISQWVVRDIAVRGADLAQVPITALVGSGRHYWGAGLTLAAAMCALVSAFALMRCASAGRGATAKYVAPAARRAAAQRDESATAMSERMIWDALDEGTDPTERPAPSAQSALPESDTEGR
ncbi:MAG: rane protein [Mycobacterium sp.]|jgi:uncharacterized membrane protein (TIGR02234 family)|nr:rane protein [Mycobacterium sp.]